MADASGMDRRSRELVLPALVAGGCALLLGAMGLRTPEFTDFELEAAPSLQALQLWQWAEFLELAPAYGGSLILRAPFALLPELWDGGGLALFRSMAAPCLAAASLLAVTLWLRARELGRSRATCWIALALVAANPLTLEALEIGHPEELLGGVLCVGAGLLATRGHAVLAGLLLGLAIANKPWALLAVVPLLAILPTSRWRLLAVSGATAGLVMLPLALAGGAVQEAAAVARDTSNIFKPGQVWWFLGESGYFDSGAKAGYRVGPEWVTGTAHPLVVLVPMAIGLALLPRLRQRPWHDGLLLLAFTMLLRCLLDPWNVSYYSLPFLLALVAWEVHAEPRPPVLSLAATLLSWLTLVSLTTNVHPDIQAAAYLAWSVPLAVWMGARLLGLRQGARAPSVALRAI